MANEQQVHIDSAALQKMRDAFLDENPMFGGFADPAEKYLVEERRYKDELRSLFAQEVMPLLHSRDDQQVGSIPKKIYSVLSRGLHTLNKSAQNLMRWNTYDYLNKVQGHVALEVGNLFCSLVDEEKDLVPRLSDFAERLPQIIDEHVPWKKGRRSWQGLLRSLTSFVLSYAYPDRYCFVLTGVMAHASRMLAGGNICAEYTAGRRSLGEEYRDIMALAGAVRTALADWEPKDFIDIQSFLWVCKKMHDRNEIVENEKSTDLDDVDEAVADAKPPCPAYTEQDFLEDVFLDAGQYARLKSLLHHKKNLVLQGAPGVGKTYAAERLVWSLMGEQDPDRYMIVQFHQSYSYEDFIMGYRPTDSGFELRSGPFYDFCAKARQDGRPHYFLIDEINRGNLSKIFGELLMLIEHDKRGKQVQLLYGGEPFDVPENLHVLGMMNTADRSLALIDYALRRRFAFFELCPAFDSKGFTERRKKLANTMFDELVGNMVELNREIAEAPDLGRGFCIGHSYFCLGEQDMAGGIESRLEAVVEHEILPLLEEYWFEAPDKTEHWASRLRRIVHGRG